MRFRLTHLSRPESLKKSGESDCRSRNVVKQWPVIRPAATASVRVDTIHLACSQSLLVPLNTPYALRTVLTYWELYRMRRLIPFDFSFFFFFFFFECCFFHCFDNHECNRIAAMYHRDQSLKRSDAWSPPFHEVFITPHNDWYPTPTPINLIDAPDWPKIETFVDIVYIIVQATFLKSVDDKKEPLKTLIFKPLPVNLVGLHFPLVFLSFCFCNELLSYYNALCYCLEQFMQNVQVFHCNRWVWE